MNHQPETIVILGGGLVKDPAGFFRTINFEESGDRAGITGDRLRVEAAHCLYQENNQRGIVASGGQGFIAGEHPNISSVIKKELVQLGVPEGKITEENMSNNTYQQLLFLKDLFSRQAAAKVIILTNKWHLPRVRAIIKNNQGLKSFYNGIKPKYLAAERVLLKHNPGGWREIIKSAYASEAMRERLKLEKQGIKQIKNETYKYE